MTARSGTKVLSPADASFCNVHMCSAQSVLTIKRSEILVIGEAGVVSRADGMRVIARMIAGEHLVSGTASSPADEAR